ncbi:MAG: hypothetical protein HRU00_10250 [Myxococcales bacterium]|nr:hypothetical protein [Myxococcales bacterium]
MAARRRAKRKHGSLPERIEGIEGQAEGLFGWIGDNPRPVLLAIAAFVVVGALIAGGYELWLGAQLESQQELGRIESEFARAMGAPPGALVFVEPANPDQGRRARESALGGLEGLIEQRAGSRAAELASLRAAEIELDLGRGDAVVARLDELTSELAEDDPLRGVALRLLGTARTDGGDLAAGAEAYAAAAGIEGYRDPAPLWIAAGRGFSASGLPQRAIEAYNQALVADLSLSEQEGLVDRIAALEVQLAEPAASAPSDESDNQAEASPVSARGQDQ